MKIAICLSGQSRLFKTSFKLFKKHLLDEKNCDIFIDTWKFINTQEDVRSFFRYKDEGDLEELFGLYKPKILNVEHFDENFEKKALKFEEEVSKIQGGRSDNYLRRYYSMLYKIFNCNKLKNEYANKFNIEYDIVVRARMDILYSKNINFIQTENLVIDNYGSSNGVGDIFAYGTKNAMDEYSNLFNLLDDYINEKVHIETQTLLPHHINKFIKNYKTESHGLNIARPDVNWLNK